MIELTLQSGAKIAINPNSVAYLLQSVIDGHCNIYFQAATDAVSVKESYKDVTSKLIAAGGVIW